MLAKVQVFKKCALLLRLKLEQRHKFNVVVFTHEMVDLDGL